MARHISIRTTALIALVAAAALAATLLLARGPEADAASGKTLHITADKSRLKFNRTTLHVHHGKVTILMANPSSIPHGVGIKGHGKDRDGKTVTKGGTSRVTLTLKKGTYTFYCPVPGHEAAGMKGKLVVS